MVRNPTVAVTISGSKAVTMAPTPIAMSEVRRTGTPPNRSARAPPTGRVAVARTMNPAARRAASFTSRP